MNTNSGRYTLLFATTAHFETLSEEESMPERSWQPKGRPHEYQLSLPVQGILAGIRTGLIRARLEAALP